MRAIESLLFRYRNVPSEAAEWRLSRFKGMIVDAPEKSILPIEILNFTFGYLKRY
jgi:hypothetical protein